MRSITLALMLAGDVLTTTTAAGPAAVREGRLAGAFLYVTNQFDGNVSVIDVDARKVVRTIAAGKAPSGVAAAPGGDRVYVADQGSGCVGDRHAGRPGDRDH
jgi:YVTN family beta-propeller protein